MSPQDDVIVHQTLLLDKTSGTNSGSDISGRILDPATTPDTRRGHDIVPHIPGCTAEDCSSVNGCSGKANCWL